MTKLKQEIFALVSQIPYGKVASYRDIGRLVGTQARVVGFILSGMKQEEWELIPWHRVIAQSGLIPTLKLGYKGMLQIQLLQDEGVLIHEDMVDISTYQFNFDEP